MKAKNGSFAEAAAAFGVFCALTAASRQVEAALHVMALTGLVFPLLWGRITGGWKEMGFTTCGLVPAVGWGLVTGLASSVIGYWAVPESSLVADLGPQLAIGIPMWFLLASPFQEFFFRGWLQPRWEAALGKGRGLVVATALFTSWHYLLPIFAGSSQSSFPLYSLRGLTATFAAGLIYGFGFQHTGNIVTPWLAHALSGVMFVAIGSGSFLPPGP